MIEVIPTGASAVVTSDSDDCATKVNLMEAIRGAEADLERSSGQHFGDTICAVKDAQADLERSNGQHFGDTLCAIKDAQADLERSGGQHFGDTLRTVKDADANIRFAIKDSEANLERSHGKALEDLRSVEANLERSSGSRYGETLKTVKETECDIIEAVKDTAMAHERDECRTRELLAQGFKELSLQDCQDTGLMKDALQEARKEIEAYIAAGFKDSFIEFKNMANLSNRLAMDADKTRASNHMQTLLQFKEQALLSEKLAFAASKENAEHFCQVKELIRCEADKTRTLVNDIEKDRLKERAAKAENALNSYFARGAPPTSPTV